MTTYDVVVLGLTRAGTAVADALAASHLRTAAVRLSPNDDAADRLSFALENAALPQSGPLRFDLLAGPAAFLAPGRLRVADGEVRAKRVVIACGAQPRLPDGFDGIAVSTALDALTAPAGESAVVLGGGPVAAVVADRLRARGGEVTIAARSPRLLPKEDESVSDILSGRLRARGVNINTSVSGLSVSPNGGGFHARFCCGGDNREAAVNRIVAATGLAADLNGLDLPKAGVMTKNGRVLVNDEMRTSNPRVWAVGHGVEPGASLALQDHHAEVAAHNVSAPFWGRKRLSTEEAPFTLRTSPPVARVGLSEAAAKAKFRDVVVATAPYFDAPGQEGEPSLVKLVGRRRGSRLLGAHIVGVGACETILFFDTLMRAEIPIPDVPDRRHFPLPGPSDAAYRALVAWTQAAD